MTRRNLLAALLVVPLTLAAAPAAAQDKPADPKSDTVTLIISGMT